MNILNKELSTRNKSDKREPKSEGNLLLVKNCHLLNFITFISGWKLLPCLTTTTRFETYAACLLLIYYIYYNMKKMIQSEMHAFIRVSWSGKSKISNTIIECCSYDTNELWAFTSSIEIVVVAVVVVCCGLSFFYFWTWFVNIIRTSDKVILLHYWHFFL